MMRGSEMRQGPQTTTVQVAGNVDRSGAVLLLGGGLIVVNAFFGSEPPLISYFAPTAKGQIPASVFLPFAGEFLALFLLILLAKFGGEAGGNLAVIFLAAIWVVWLLNKPAALGRILGQGSQKGPPQVNEPNHNKA